MVCGSPWGDEYDGARDGSSVEGHRLARSIEESGVRARERLTVRVPRRPLADMADWRRLRVLPSRRASNRTGVIRPMEHGLALPAAALEIASLAVLPDRRDMAGNRPPAPDLAGVVRRSAPHVVAAVPLEPAARVLRMDPALTAPGGERLRRVNAEVVEPRVTAPPGKSGAGEPARRKLGAAVSHVPASEHAQTQHLAWSQLRQKPGGEVTADWLCPVIDVLRLHPIGDDNSPAQSGH